MRIHAIRVCKKEYHKQLRVTGNAAGSARYTKKFCIRDIPDHRTGIRKKEYKDQITEIAAGKLPGGYRTGGIIVVLGLHAKEAPVFHFLGAGKQKRYYAKRFGKYSFASVYSCAAGGVA